MPDVPLRRSGTYTAIWITRIVLVGVLLVIFWLLANHGMFGRWSSGEVSTERITMPISKVKISAGQIIDASHIGHVVVTLPEIKPDFLLDDAQILGCKAKIDIEPNKAFRESWVISRSMEVNPAPPAAVLEKGWVVVTLDLNKVEAPLEMLHTGTAVVVVATKDSESGPDQISVITRKARVVAVNLPSSKGARAEELGILLQMPASDSLRFVQAQRSCHFTLVIVTPGQEEALNFGEGVDSGPKDQIEIIRGNKRSFEAPPKKTEPE